MAFFTEIKSIFGMRCPDCHKGKLFKVQWPKSFNDLWDMPKHCTVCGKDFDPEPGFYYGAMFISYIISGFLGLGLYPLFAIVFDLSFEWALGLDVAILLLGIPYMFRISRSIYIHLVKWVKAGN